MSWAEDEGYDGWDSDDFAIHATPKEARNEQTWTTKDGRTMLVKDMADDHLFNVYMFTGAEFLFAEMVYRLFEKRL